MAWGSRTIKELADDFHRGEILLPEMQRSFVWQSSQVMRLFDSLYRGYPIGTILLWGMKGSVVTRPSAFETETQDGTHLSPSILLDGQQRLTSVVHVLNGKKNLCFNLQHPETTEDDEFLEDKDDSDEKANVSVPSSV